MVCKMAAYLTLRKKYTWHPPSTTRWLCADALVAHSHLTRNWVPFTTSASEQNIQKRKKPSYFFLLCQWVLQADFCVHIMAPSPWYYLLHDLDCSFNIIGYHIRTISQTEREKSFHYYVNFTPWIKVHVVAIYFYYTHCVPQLPFQVVHPILLLLSKGILFLWFLVLYCCSLCFLNATSVVVVVTRPIIAYYCYQE